jgi:hypothetical protein
MEISELPRTPEGTTDAPGRRAGYLIVVLLDLVMLWIAHQLLDWQWPSFLTGAFEDLLPWITASLAATAIVNLVWVFWDPEWFRHLTQFGLDVLSLAVAVRTWQIFPFDFSSYSSGWETLARVAIVVGIVGSAIGAVVELVKLARSGHRPADTVHGPHWA